MSRIPADIHLKAIIALQKSDLKEEEKKTPVGAASSTPSTVSSSPYVSLSSINSSASSIMASPASLHSSKSKGSRNRAAGATERTFSNANPLPNMVMHESVANYIYKHRSTQVTQAFITTSVVGQVFTATNFSLSTTVPDYTTLTALFDQYRCRQIEAWIVPRIGPAQVTAAANTGLLLSAVDYDDSAVWANFNLGLEYRNAIVAEGSQGHYRSFRPHFAVAAYSGAFSSFANEDPDTWIDCVNPAVQFYGLKTASEQTDIVYIYDLILRTSWEFRNSR
jgi:hypothetical protein